MCSFFFTQFGYRDTYHWPIKELKTTRQCVSARCGNVFLHGELKYRALTPRRFTFTSPRRGHLAWLLRPQYTITCADPLIRPIIYIRGSQSGCCLGLWCSHNHPSFSSSPTAGRDSAFFHDHREWCARVWWAIVWTSSEAHHRPPCTRAYSVARTDPAVSVRRARGERSSAGCASRS